MTDNCARQSHLLEIVHALGTPGRPSGRLNGRQQQGDQDRDDRDHHQKLDQNECNQTVTTGFRPRHRDSEMRPEIESTVNDNF
jgi:hypothetical protein